MLQKLYFEPFSISGSNIAEICSRSSILCHLVPLAQISLRSSTPNIAKICSRRCIFNHLPPRASLEEHVVPSAPWHCELLPARRRREARSASRRRDISSFTIYPSLLSAFLIYTWSLGTTQQEHGCSLHGLDKQGRRQQPAGLKITKISKNALIPPKLNFIYSLLLLYILVTTPQRPR